MARLNDLPLSLGAIASTLPKVSCRMSSKSSARDSNTGENTRNKKYGTRYSTPLSRSWSGGSQTKGDGLPGTSRRKTNLPSFGCSPNGPTSFAHLTVSGSRVSSSLVKYSANKWLANQVPDYQHPWPRPPVVSPHSHPYIIAYSQYFMLIFPRSLLIPQIHFSLVRRLHVII